MTSTPAIRRLALLLGATAATALAPSATAQDAVMRLSSAKQPARIHRVAPARPSQLLMKLHDVLAAHGEWIEHPRHGTVWAPRVEAGFAPFVTEGRWAANDVGDWTWVSDYPWGDIAFHYGSWTLSRDRAWLWLPGSDPALGRAILTHSQLHTPAAAGGPALAELLEARSDAPAPEPPARADESPYPDDADELVAPVDLAPPPVAPVETEPKPPVARMAERPHCWFTNTWPRKRVCNWLP